MDPHEVQDLEQAFVLVMLYVYDFVEQSVLKVDNDETSRFFLLDLYHAFEQSKDLG